MLDNYLRKNWNYLMKRKSEVTAHLKSPLKILKSKGKQVKYIQCGNAGEHKTLKIYCEKKF